MEKLWKKYKTNPTQKDRDKLIVHYAPLVHHVAARVGVKLPQNLDQADLVSYGMFGLIDAITKFEPDRGFKFETYATSRIKGAIFDELRSIDWVPRSVRAKAKLVDRAALGLESKLHRVPTDSELAEELGISAEQLAKLHSQTSSLGMTALDAIQFSDSDGMTLGDMIPGLQEHSDEYDHEEMRELLVEAIGNMSQREDIMLTLYYYENLTLAEIGVVLGVTESRVCQIHTKLVLYLRSRFGS